MKKLLQEIKSFQRYGKESLSPSLYREYRRYLYEKILKEFSTKALYHIFINSDHKKEPVEQRLEKVVKQFQNTKYYNTDPIIKVRKKSGRTNLELSNGKFCNKQDFENEFLAQNFDDNSEAEKFLRSITDLFDDEGWLKL